MAKIVSLAKTIFILLACFMLTFTVGCSLPRLVDSDFWSSLFHSAGSAGNGGEFDDQLNILLLGIDARPGETMARSDTIMLARIDKKARKVALVSIPRDTRIEVPGSSVPKINHACMIGGPELACKVVGKLMGTKVDYYVLTNFNGFKDIIDTLGGVTINVEQRMLKRSEGINLHPGLQRLNGSQALAYVRYRGYQMGDITRAEHQQKFMLALAEEMFQTRTVTKLPKLVPQLAKNVKTNLSLGEMISLAGMAKDFKPENLYAQTLPGYFYNDPENGISYWIADKKIAGNILDELLAGKKVAVVETSPYPEVSKPKQKASTGPTWQPPAASDAPVTQPEQLPEDQVPGDDGIDGGTTGPYVPYTPENPQVPPTTGPGSTPGSVPGTGTEPYPEAQPLVQNGTATTIPAPVTTYPPMGT